MVAIQPQYKDTLNLPVTSFPMKAGAATREPEIQTAWAKHQVYEQVANRPADGPTFVLHDGPPYLSSDKIHIGTALNKVLKDIVVRYYALLGYRTPYVPGYDGHGLPIENAVVKQLPKGRESVSQVELRRLCREFALKNLKGQEGHFKRLGVWGNWEHPYITIDADFEATQIRLFAEMADKGYVYKGLKPVYWSTTCETALAEAEVEYADHKSHSVYVAFTVLPGHLPELAGCQCVIWTTTPWTLPSNVALAVNPDFEYVLAHVGDARYLLAKGLLSRVAELLGWENPTVSATYTGAQLAGLLTQHPFVDRTSVVLTGSHVTLEAGTGIVHTAPGHGLEDYEAVVKYNLTQAVDGKLPVLSPINNKGVFTEDVGQPFAGLFYAKANPVVVDLLKEKNALLHHSEFIHSYPHCWRSGDPVIYRATEQWFIGVDAFREQALAEIAKVNWVPARGENRIGSMVANRSDWCISRQRVWGVPIPAFYCEHCGTTHMEKATIAHVENVFRQHTSDIWWEWATADLMPAGTVCSSCGHGSFTKEMDIMDVWFDSGVTHTAVVKARSEELGNLPVDLYLEGSDQHRGWFQSSLLTSVMLHGHAPYKQVLTHGFVLDQDGRKMSKSLGNVIDPESIISQYGADVLRLWVASVDFTNDVRIGPETIKQLTEVYKKVRNTVRYLMGNLADFDATQHMVPYEQLGLLDKFTLHRLAELTEQLTDAFKTYEFHRFYQLIQNFCVVDLSSLYLDIAKDILYCDAKASLRRRSIQTVMHHILLTLIRVIVPVMPHMADDMWSHLPKKPIFEGQTEVASSVQLCPWPVAAPEWLSPTVAQQVAPLLALRDLVNKQIELPRSQGVIGSALECAVYIQTDAPEAMAALNQGQADDVTKTAMGSSTGLAELFIVSQASVSETTEPALSEGAVEGLRVKVTRAKGNKCARCWRVLSTVGQFEDHPTLCQRCYTAVVDG
jgi:isoleucyl-tRNA synthetase